MFWIHFLNWLEQVGSWLLVGVFISGLVALIALIIWKIPERITAVVLTTLSCVICLIPLVSSINILVEAKVKGTAISEKKAELKALELKVENEMVRKQNLELQNENLYKDIQIKNLDDEIDLLKSTQLSMNSWNEICEVALLETKLKTTDVRKEIINSEKGKGILADKIDYEALVITTYDMCLKLGIDLKEVVVREDKKDEKNKKLIISGIKTKTSFGELPVPDYKVKEIRKIEYKGGEKSNISILYDKINLNKADEKAQEYAKGFKERFNKGLEIKDDAVIKSGQNFIKFILAPLKREIIFDDSSASGGVPLLDYLNNEIETKQEEKDKLQKEKQL